MIKVLFVCVENSCRSQMAEGFARQLGKNMVMAYSAGSKPSGKINQSAVEVMQEAGIDISASRFKGFAELPVSGFDYVVGMGCGDTCPVVPAKKHITWPVEDPKGKDMDFFRRVRDNIRNRVGELVDRISHDKEILNKEIR